MSVHQPSARTECGIGSANPVFRVSSLETAVRFYEQLGFAIRRHGTAYAHAVRERLTIDLRASADYDPLATGAEVYVETRELDSLHAEWRALDLMPVRTIITPDMRAELRRRAATDDRIGLISDRVRDQPGGLREFTVRDPDNNQLRFGRPSSGGAPEG